MRKILDNIEPDNIELYFQRFADNPAFQHDIDRKVHSIMDFLEWAYEKDYIGFHKYQQIRDELDKKTASGPTQKEEPAPTPVIKREPPQTSIPENTPFYIAHAYLLLPLFTGIIVVILYLFLGYNSSTVSPVNIESLNNQRSPQNTKSYILPFNKELVDEFGIPLKQPTTLRFRLYQGPNTTEAVYDTRTTGSCKVEPLFNGAVQVDIGQACGTPIPGSIFAASSQVWLGVTVGTNTELQPRTLVTLTNQGLSMSTSPSQNETSTNGNDLLFASRFATDSADLIVQASDSAHIRLLTGGIQAVDISSTGNVGINRDDPKHNLDILGDVNIDAGQLKIGSFSSNPPPIGNGALYYNTDDNKIYFYNGSKWAHVGSELQSLILTGDESSSTVAKILNENKGKSADGLDIQLGYEDNGSTDNSFITFRNGKASVQGRISSNAQGGITYATSGSDFAEFFRKDLTTSYNDDSFSAGSLICHSFDGVAPCNTTSKYIIGAVSDNPGFVGGDHPTVTDQHVLVGMVGQLTIKVYNDGTIKPGDALTLSTYPGYAERARQKGYIVGYAQETPLQKGLTTVKAHIQPSYFDPLVYDGSSESDKPSYLADVSQRVKTLVAEVIEATTAKIDTIIANSIFAKNIEGGKITADNMTTGKIVATSIESPVIDEIVDNATELQEKTTIKTFIADDSTLNSEGAADRQNSLASTATSTTSTSINTESADAGEGIIKAGIRQVTIFNENVSASSLVYLTSTSMNQNRTIYVAEKRGCLGENVEQSTTKAAADQGAQQVANQTGGQTCQAYFKVSIDKPLEDDITFNWWVVN